MYGSCILQLKAETDRETALYCSLSHSREKINGGLCGNNEDYQRFRVFQIL